MTNAERILNNLHSTVAEMFDTAQRDGAEMVLTLCPDGRAVVGDADGIKIRFRFQRQATFEEIMDDDSGYALQYEVYRWTGQYPEIIDPWLVSCLKKPNGDSRNAVD